MKKECCLCKKIKEKSTNLRKKISSNKEIINILLTILITFFMSWVRNVLSIARALNFDINGFVLLTPISDTEFYRTLIKDFLLIIITWNFTGVFRLLCKGDNQRHSSFLTLFMLFSFVINVVWYVVEVLFASRYWIIILGAVLFLMTTAFSVLFFRNKDVEKSKSSDYMIAPSK